MWKQTTASKYWAIDCHVYLKTLDAKLLNMLYDPNLHAKAPWVTSSGQGPDNTTNVKEKTYRTHFLIFTYTRIITLAAFMLHFYSTSYMLAVEGQHYFMTWWQMFWLQQTREMWAWQIQLLPQPPSSYEFAEKPLVSTGVLTQGHGPHFENHCCMIKSWVIQSDKVSHTNHWPSEAWNGPDQNLTFALCPPFAVSCR